MKWRKGTINKNEDERDNKKRLPRQIGSELWLNPEYAIARFMGSQRAWSTKQNPDMMFTLKPVQEKGLNPQMQLHIRFKGLDFGNGSIETPDVDIYIDLNEWSKTKIFHY